MRIAVVGARGIPDVEGGAEKNAEMLFPLVAKHHDVTLFSIRSFAKDGDYRGVKIVSAPEVRFLRTDKLVVYMMAVLRSFRMRPDIIHCQGLGSALFLVLYKLAARRVVVRYGSADYDMDKWGFLGRMGFRFSEWQLRFADAVIVVAPALLKRLQANGIKTRAELIPNALDAVEMFSQPDTELMATHGLTPRNFALGVGRVTPQKDFATLVRAFRKARESGQCPIEKLVIVGGSDGSGTLEALQDEAGPDVVFAGRLARSQVRALLGQSALYVNSSVHEGMSNAILEAVSAGAPTVVSDIPENRDLPLAGHNFFRTGDADALAQRLCEAAKDLNRFVPDRAPFADWEKVAEMTMALYDSLFVKRD